MPASRRCLAMRAGNHGRRTVFLAQARAQQNLPPQPPLTDERQHEAMAEDDESSIEELPIRPAVDNPTPQFIPDVPALFTSPPPISDPVVTKTSEQQQQTVQLCLPFLKGISDNTKTVFDFSVGGFPRLDREQHVEFLTEALENARFMAYDPSRPWILYWALVGLTLLGQDVSSYRQRCVWIAADYNVPS